MSRQSIDRWGELTQPSGETKDTWADKDLMSKICEVLGGHVTAEITIEEKIIKIESQSPIGLSFKLVAEIARHWGTTEFAIRVDTQDGFSETFQTITNSIEFVLP